MERQTEVTGCLADTGFLYAIAYEDDRLHGVANDVLDALAENRVSIFANVVSRMEFVDLIFRKQVTRGTIQLFESINPSSIHKNTWNLLKNIRDQNTGHVNQGLSYKIDESRLKKLRAVLEEASSALKWTDFCCMKSTLPLLVTSDSDFQRCFEDQDIPLTDKVVFHLN